jgi:hypothetical protein
MGRDSTADAGRLSGVGTGHAQPMTFAYVAPALWRGGM